MRTLKPEFWTDEVIVELSFAARLFYQGCWNFALCDRGHLDDSPKSLKLKILPADDVDPVELIDELMRHGRLLRKQTSDGRTYLQVPTLDKHSKADTRWNSRCIYCTSEGSTKPVSAPPSSPGHTETHQSSGESSETQEKSSSKGREGKGREGIKGGPRKRGLRLPDDWAITEPMRIWARERVPNVDVDWHNTKFVNYWRSKTRENTKLDWPRTWQNWMLEEQEKAARNGSRAATTAPASVAPDRIPPAERCPDHRDQRATTCRHCAAMRKAGDFV